jgi:hypothetical protein
MPTIQEINRDLADKLYHEARRDPRSPYAGKKVGIANGKVVVVSESWTEVGRAVRAAEPDLSRTCCIDTAQDYDSVQEIWEAM